MVLRVLIHMKSVNSYFGYVPEYFRLSGERIDGAKTMSATEARKNLRERLGEL